MNAIKMLKQQHREVEGLFEQLEKARTGPQRQKVFDQIADALAAHATIEERHFYPSVKKRDTEDILLESTEEHLAIKRVIADLLDCEPSDERFEAKCKVLKDEVEHHVEEEEGELFPKVQKLFDDEALKALGEEMQATWDELMEAGNPREAVPSETEHAAPL
jgi:hemerythrin superfamily protein